MASSGLRSVLVRSTKMPSNLFSSSTLSGSIANRLQVAAIAGVADERLVAPLERPLQRGEDRGAIGGVLGGFLKVAADDVAPGGQHDRLGLVVDLPAALGHHQRHEGRTIVEHPLKHQVVAALAHTQDIKQAARFE